MLRCSESIEDNSLVNYYRIAKTKCEEKERNRHGTKFILAPHRRPDKAGFHSPGERAFRRQRLELGLPKAHQVWVLDLTTLDA